MRKAPRYLLTIVAVTAVAFLLSETALNKLLSLSTYSGGNESFSYSDFYVRTASHGIARMSDEVAVVDIGDLSRSGIAALLDSLSAMKPEAVGLDVFFRFPGQQGDDLLTEAVGISSQSKQRSERDHKISDVHKRLFVIKMSRHHLFCHGNCVKC